VPTITAIAIADPIQNLDVVALVIPIFMPSTPYLYHTDLNLDLITQ